MASHQVAIAKASLAAGLLRADPIALARDEITNFHSLLDKALTACSPSNIQTCKRWILKNMNSRARASSLGKYLTALSPTLAPTAGSKTSPRKKRLHVLYLLNDVLYHTTFHEPDQMFANEFRPFLKDLFTAAVSPPSGTKKLARLERLLELWDQKGYYADSFIAELRVTVKEASVAKPMTFQSKPTETLADNRNVVQKTMLLPLCHGDPSFPFYDLPAANLLPHMVPNTTTPINPRLVKPIQFHAITPSENLVTAVKEFMKSAERIFSGNDVVGGEPDALGGIGGVDGEGYYGWSRSFCDNMKLKKKDAAEERHGRSRSGTSERGRARGRDRSTSRGRYSYSDSSSSNSRGNRRRRHRSSSYSKSRSRSSSKSRSRGRSGARRKYRDSRSRSPSRSRSRSRSPAKQSFQQFQPPLQQQNATYPPLPPDQFQGFPPPPPPPPPQMQFGYAQQPPQNWIIPPPPLPHNANFPPPPPPPSMAGNPHAQQMMQQQFQQYGYPLAPAGPMHMQGFQGPWNAQGNQYPPPPPPPPHQQLQQNAYGYTMGNQSVGTGSGNEGAYDDYRSIKGREIGAKRGWKT
ncbi:hypothetical protein RUND412_006650 [Rhizina undulata]